MPVELTPVGLMPVTPSASLCALLDFTLAFSWICARHFPNGICAEHFGAEHFGAEHLRCRHLQRAGFATRWISKRHLRCRHLRWAGFQNGICERQNRREVTQICKYLFKSNAYPFASKPPKRRTSVSQTPYETPKPSPKTPQTPVLPLFGTA